VQRSLAYNHDDTFEEVREVQVRCGISLRVAGAVGWGSRQEDAFEGIELEVLMAYL
jgi:hypothetical protein